MKYLILLSSFSVIFCARGDLIPISFDNFLRETEYVLEIKVEKSHAEKVGGMAVATILDQVFAEKEHVFPTASKLGIHWSSEKHDQALRKTGETFLVFLKFDVQANLPRASVYGRSYWKIEVNEEGEEVIFIQNPIDEVIPESSLVKKGSDEYYLLDELKPHIITKLVSIKTTSRTSRCSECE